MNNKLHNEVGCDYPALPLDSDYVGVTFGRLRWDPASQGWIGDAGASPTAIVERKRQSQHTQGGIFVRLVLGQVDPLFLEEAGDQQAMLA